MPGDNHYFIYQYFIGYSNTSVHIISCPKNGAKIPFTLWHSKGDETRYIQNTCENNLNYLFIHTSDTSLNKNNGSLSRSGEYDSNNKRSDTIHPSSLILREK